MKKKERILQLEAANNELREQLSQALSANARLITQRNQPLAERFADRATARARARLVSMFDAAAGEQYDHYLQIDQYDLAERAIIWDRASSRYRGYHEQALRYMLDQCTTLADVNDAVVDMVQHGVQVEADIVAHRCRQILPGFGLNGGWAYGNDSYHAYTRSGSGTDNTTNVRTQMNHAANQYVFPPVK